MPQTATSRPLRGYENLFAQWHEEMGPLLHLVRVDGDIPPERLRAATHLLLRRHPALRARIRWPEGPATRPVFDYPDPDPDDIPVEEITELPDDGSELPAWHQLVEREARRPFDPGAQALFRVRRIADADGSWLVLAAHHACVDGAAMARTVHELIAACANGAAESDIQPGPTVAAYDRIQGSRWKRHLLPLAIWLRAREIRGFLATHPFRWAEPVEEGGTDFVFAFREGSPQSFSALRARARREGVTIGAAFSAASQFAFVRCLERWGGVVPRRRGRVALQMDTLFDLRRRVSPPADPDLMTLFVGPGAVCAPVADDVEFWELARRLLRATRRTAKSGLPADFHIILDGLHDLRAAIAKYDIDYGPSGGVGSTLAISNVGKFPYATEYGDLRMRKWFGGLAPGFGGAPAICWLRTLGDRLMYNFAALTPVISRARCEELADELSRTLEGCAEADQSWTLLG